MHYTPSIRQHSCNTLFGEEPTTTTDANVRAVVAAEGGGKGQAKS